MLGHTIAGQNNLFVWCRDHRVHHKFSETDADPHNSLRGVSLFLITFIQSIKINCN